MAKKERIIGILVIGCLMVLVFPVLFDQELPVAVPDFEQEISVAPEFKPFRQIEVPVELDQIKSTEKRIEQRRERFVAEGDKALVKVKVKKPEQPEVKISKLSKSTIVVTSNKSKAGKPVAITEKVVVSKKAASVSERKGQSAVQAGAWLIQVSSFRTRSNAVRLRDKLRGKKFRAFIKDFAKDKQSFYRVYVGPESQWKVVQANKSVLDKQFGLKGLIVKYDPLVL